MRNRSLLHANKLADFTEYLETNNHKILPIKGAYEVWRWKNKSGKPMPILFTRLKGDHYTSNSSATPFGMKFISKNKEEKTNER